ncbi:MAG: hypothetical protein IMX00_09285 [Limnochordales bacterium]|nr:hypothetical protein [Limnochordales bacterium]
MRSQEGVWVAGRAKLNLGLAVTGRRRDGYHLLLTLFHSVELHDWVLVGRDDPAAAGPAAAPPEVRWVCRAGENGVHRAQLVGAGREREAVLSRCLGAELVPADASNLACRAVVEVAGAGIVAVRRIIKSIPAGAGLGGGSADAAAAWRAAALLAGVTRAAGRGRGEGEELIRRAARLGADVPFALTGGAALAAGIGEELVRLPPLDFPVILVKPEFSLATAEVFGWYDEDRERGQDGVPTGDVAGAGGDATRFREAVLALAQVLAAGDGKARRRRFARYLRIWGRELPNELALSVYHRSPQLEVWRERLASSSALAFGLTGSGSALFALAEDDDHLERLWGELVRPWTGTGRPPSDLLPAAGEAKATSTSAAWAAPAATALLIATRLWPGPGLSYRFR